MKKNLLGSLLLLSIVNFNAFSQKKTPQKPVKTGNEWKMPSDAFKRSKTFADNLKKSLGLDSVQTKKVYEAFLNNTKPTDEISIMPNGEEKKAKTKANQEAFKATIKGILSPTQFEKYLKLK